MKNEYTSGIQDCIKYTVGNMHQHNLCNHNAVLSTLSTYLGRLCQALAPVKTHSKATLMNY